VPELARNRSSFARQAGFSTTPRLTTPRGTSPRITACTAATSDAPMPAKHWSVQHRA
jgi:hypothetical protein